MVVSNHVVAGN